MKFLVKELKTGDVVFILDTSENRIYSQTIHASLYVSEATQRTILIVRSDLFYRGIVFPIGNPENLYFKSLSAAYRHHHYISKSFDALARLSIKIKIYI